MKPLCDWPMEDRRQIRGVFTDIDDTLTTDGAITPDALQALGALKAAGLQVIAITGRPVGWSVPFATRWPVHAIVAENGAVALVPQPPPPAASDKNTNQIGLWLPSLLPSSLSKLYQQDADTRAAHVVRMQQVARRVLREVPGTRLAQDSPGRETDIAIDHSEFTHLPPDRIAQAVQIMRSEGMNASVSSIHINGWFGGHNKRQGAHWIVRELLQRDLAQEMDHWAYVGDSTNDQLMFEAFANSVGVANIARFVPELQHLPRYVTPGKRGAGFAQVAQALLAVH